MTRADYDVVVSGGGIAGMVAAASFGALGFRVLIVDPAPPVTDGSDPAADRRSTAFLQPARDTLDQAGAWARLADHGTALQIMRLADASGPEGSIRAIADFDAAELGPNPFGWNFPNWLLRRELSAHLEAFENVDYRPGVGTLRVVTRTQQALVDLDDGTGVTARLLIAADGRESPVRQMLGIAADRWSYDQRALVFTVSHPRPHDNVSTELHRSGGPFTLVPLPNPTDSAVVWMESSDKAAALMAQDDPEFAAAATERSCAVQGDLTVTSPRAVWPIISQRARSLTGERTVLIAEAAHVMPPIGAQGLNMSLADIRCLRDLAHADPNSLGDAAMLATYARRRHPDINLRMAGVDALNRAAIAGSDAWTALRMRGMQTLHGVTPLRRTAMRLGLGAGRLTG